MRARKNKDEAVMISGRNLATLNILMGTDMFGHQRLSCFPKKSCILNHAFGGPYDLHHMMRRFHFFNKEQ